MLRPLLPYALVLSLVVGGCQPETPPVAVVRGKVTYQGAPVPTGLIVFVPDPTRGGAGPMARGDIQPDGSYRLRLWEGEGPGRDGAVVGWHRITLHAVEPPRGTAESGPGIAPRSYLPARYRDPELSGLVREVRPGVENVLDFDLD